jgi:hypothetical protein
MTRRYHGSALHKHMAPDLASIVWLLAASVAQALAFTAHRLSSGGP